MEREPYQETLEPVLKIGDCVEVCKDFDSCSYYKVAYLEPIHVKYVTPTVSAGGSMDLKDLTNDLILGRDELGQVRVLVLTDGFELYVNQPSAIPRYATFNYIGFIDKWLSDNFGNLTEVWYLGDGAPSFRIVNTTSSDASSEIRVVGFKYGLIKLAEKPEKVKLSILVRAVPSQR